MQLIYCKLARAKVESSKDLRPKIALRFSTCLDMGQEELYDFPKVRNLTSNHPRFEEGHVVLSPESVLLEN